MLNTSALSSQANPPPPSTHSQSILIIAIINLLLGLSLCTFSLTSAVLLIAQNRRKLQSRRESNSNSLKLRSAKKQRKVPVVDVILIVLYVVMLGRVTGQSVVQIACFYGICLIDGLLPCYLYGFINNFLAYLNIWMMALLVHDRYIAHNCPHEYIRKCTHLILYITLTCASALIGLHLSGPIYGFSSYRYLPAEHHCSIDHHSRFSCPHLLYSLLFVLGPALVPLIYLTCKSTYKQLASTQPNCIIISRLCKFGQSQSSKANPHSTQLPKRSSKRSHYHSKHILLCCCCPTNSAVESHLEMQINRPITAGNSNTTNRRRSTQPSLSRSQSSTFPVASSSLRKMTRHYPQSGSPPPPILFPYHQQPPANLYRLKSQLLTHSNERLTTILCSWIFLLTLLPKLLLNLGTACCSCRLLEPPINVFYLSQIEIFGSCTAVPLVLVVCHAKLRSLAFGTAASSSDVIPVKV